MVKPGDWRSNIRRTESNKKVLFYDKPCYISCKGALCFELNWSMLILGYSLDLTCGDTFCYVLRNDVHVTEEQRLWLQHSTLVCSNNLNYDEWWNWLSWCFLGQPVLSLHSTVCISCAVLSCYGYCRHERVCWSCGGRYRWNDEKVQSWKTFT